MVCESDWDSAKTWTSLPIIVTRGWQSRQGRCASLRDSGNSAKLGIRGTLIVAAQGAFREVIYRQQGADEQRQEGKAEFCEKITPHGFRTSTLLRAPFSNASDFPGPVRSFRASDGHKHRRFEGL